MIVVTSGRNELFWRVAGVSLRQSVTSSVLWDRMLLLHIETSQMKSYRELLGCFMGNSRERCSRPCCRPRTCWRDWWDYVSWLGKGLVLSWMSCRRWPGREKPELLHSACFLSNPDPNKEDKMDAWILISWQNIWQKWCNYCLSFSDIRKINKVRRIHCLLILNVIENYVLILDPSLIIY